MAGLALLAMLQAWAEAGWLRRLDAAFARFVLDAVPRRRGTGGAGRRADGAYGRARPQLPAGRRTCCTTPRRCSAGRRRRRRRLRALLSTLPDAPARLARRAARQPAGGWPLATRPPRRPAPPPLVLRGPRLYLRRYWRYEQRRGGAGAAARRGTARGGGRRRRAALAGPPLPADAGTRRPGLAEAGLRPGAARPPDARHRRPGHRQDLSPRRGCWRCCSRSTRRRSACAWRWPRPPARPRRG